MPIYVWELHTERVSLFLYRFVELHFVVVFCCCCCAAEKPILHSKSKTISYVRYGRLLDVVVVKQCIPMLTPIWPSNRASTTDVGLCLFECVFFFVSCFCWCNSLHIGANGSMRPVLLLHTSIFFFIIVMSHFWLLAFTIISDFEYCVCHTQSKLVMQNEVVFGRRKFFFLFFVVVCISLRVTHVIGYRSSVLLRLYICVMFIN